MKTKKIVLMLAIACIVALVTAFSLPLQAANSFSDSNFATMYGAHLNYTTNITENPDGSYTVVADMYTSSAVTMDNLNLVTSEDGYYTVERAGKYLVEIWGGDGATASGKGGAGGYVYGIIDLSVGDTLYYTLGGGGQPTNTTGVGGGANGGGHHGENGSTTIGGGGGYSALFLFGKDYFKENYLDENDFLIGNISEADRISKYVMIAGGGGGGGSYGQDSNGTSDGGAGGYIGSTSGVLGSGYDVEGTFFSGLSGSSTGTSNEYTGKGGSNVPGKVVSTMWGWGKGDSPNDWRGTYNSNLIGGAGGSGNYRGGAGGAGFCGGSGGAASNVILASNVGGGGGGSSFISNKFKYQLTAEEEALLLGRQNTKSGGEVHLAYLEEIDDSYLSNLNISFARTPFFTVNDVHAVNRVYDDFGNYEDIEYTVKTEANPDGKITYAAVDYSTADIQALKFDLPEISLKPKNESRIADSLTLTVTLAPKTDFAGGNNVPLFVDDIISCTPSDTNYPAGEVNLKNQCGYVNVPLNFEVAAVNHTPQGLNPEDVVHKVSSLYVDKYQDVRSDPDADWRFHFIESIGNHVVKDSSGNVITADSVSPDETTRYIVELTVVPKQPSGKIYAKLGDVVTEKTFEEISIITVAGSGMDTLNDNVVVYNKALVYDEATDTYTLSIMIDSDSSGSVSDSEKLPTFNDVGYGSADASIGRESTVTIPITGKYTLTIKGGNGGKGGSSSIIANNGGAGGVGGNISATFYLEAGTPLKFYAGANASDATQARAGAAGGEYSYVAVLDSVASGQISYYLMIASGGGGGGGGVILGHGDNGASPTEISNTYLGNISSYMGGSGNSSGWTGGNGGSAASNYVYNGTSDPRVTLSNEGEDAPGIITGSTEKGGSGSMDCVALGSGDGSMDALKGYTVETAISKYFSVKDVTLDVAYGEKTGFEYDIVENLSDGNLEYTKITSISKITVALSISHHLPIMSFGF